MAIQRGEVYFVDLGRTVGHEQHGVRPVVVVSSDVLNVLPLVITVVPGTRGSKVQRDYQTNVRVPAGEANLPEETVFLTFQVRSLDHTRFADPPCGTVSQATLSALEQALAYTLSLPSGTTP
jgi:mRNA interferase MazF